MTAPEREEQCLLVADVAGQSRLQQRLGRSEATRAVERCVKRMERAVAGHGGRLLKADQGDFTAVFASPDEALQAAHDMQQRVADLPPVSGVKMALHVGVHYGPLIEDGARVSGEGTDVAAQLARLAKAGQIVTSDSAVRLLAPALRHLARELTDIGTNDSGHAVFELTWPGMAPQPDRVETEIFPISDSGPLTVVEAVPGLDRPRPKLVYPPPAAQLIIRHLGGKVVVDAARRAITLGRDPHSDVVVFDKRASRNHARVERRVDKFYLVDESTNGTFVTFEGELEFLLKREELVLRGRGRFCCGHSRAEGTERIEFEVRG